eukprot:m.46986 g.46986  ORF g.46986 m.46986 type:complete len:408 (-) comp11206_c0_seq1:37-1260(-)
MRVSPLSASIRTIFSLFANKVNPNMKLLGFMLCLGIAAAGFFSSSTVDQVDDLSGCGELLPKSFRMSKMGFTVACPTCEDGKVKAKVSYDPGRWLPTIDIADASADIELTDNGDTVTIEYENLDLGPLNHHIMSECDWLNLTHGSYTFDKFAAGSDTLKVKEKMVPGDTLVSKNRLFQLELQKDGNLVLTEAAVVNFTLWESKTEGGPGKAVLEANGDFVIYDKKKRNVWHSDTADQKVTMLKLRNDGNIVLFAGNDAVWQSGESCCDCDEDAEVAETTSSKGTRSYLERVKSFFKSSEDEDEESNEDEEKEEKAEQEEKDKEEEEEDEEEEASKKEKEKKRKADEKKKKEKKAKSAKADKEKAASKKKDAKKNKNKNKKGDSTKKQVIKSYIKKKAKEYLEENEDL